MVVDPCIFVIFGGTGDLARRKLLPALARLFHNGRANPRSCVVGVGLDEFDDDSYRSSIHASLIEHRVDEPTTASLCDARLQYEQVAGGGSLTGLAARLDAIAADRGVDNRVFYLALPPSAFAPTLDKIGEAGVNRGQGWVRVVIEKPFGRDLASAVSLNQTLHDHFDEKQIYRIDHYLGKDTVQNLLTYRFANAMIESSWNRDRVDSVQITVGESLGVGSRAGYYDRAGALRDMVQNHLMQLLTLVAMEPPTAFAASPIRREKIKVLECIEPIQPKDFVRGRYGAGIIDGQRVAAYMDEDGVPENSTTETFVALRMFIDNWRWKGVPFYLRTGKRMPMKTSQIAIRFKDAPVRFFESMGCSRDTADILLITLQPSEGFTFHLDVKVPGEPFELRRIPMRFAYADMGKVLPDAYDTLLHDIMEGDQTLFVHAEETERSWRIFADLLDGKTEPETYPSGTWGPSRAKEFAIPEADVWQTRPTHMPPGGLG